MEDNKPLDRFTRKQLRGLEDRLAELKAKSHDIAQRIKEAREQGDITENSEYDSAMDDQRKNESEIADLEALLSRSVVIDKIDTKKVSVGCLVTVMNITKNRESTYEIVGSPILVDVLLGKISDFSPVGKGLAGAKPGQEVTVELPAGPVVYKILSIAKSEDDEPAKPAKAVKAAKPKKEESEKPAKAKKEESAKPAKAKKDDSAKPTKAKKDDSAKPAKAKKDESEKAAKPKKTAKKKED